MKEDGSVQPGRSLLHHQPFRTTDLLNWKHHDPAYSDKLQTMTDLLESIFHTHHQPFMSPFTTGERRCILTEAQKWLGGQATAEVLDVEGWAQETWGQYYIYIVNTIFILLHGLRAGARKPTNYVQNDNHNPKSG